LVGSYFGVNIDFGSIFGLLGIVKLFGFFISRKGEQEGKAMPAISTVASFAGQLTISSIVILILGSRFKTLERKTLAISGKPRVSWSKG
jgi:hypothetical protein